MHDGAIDQGGVLLNSWEVLGSLLGRSWYSERVGRILWGHYLAGWCLSDPSREYFTSGKFLDAFFSLHRCSHLWTLPLCGIVFIPLDKFLGSPYKWICKCLSQRGTDVNSLETTIFLFFPLYIHVWKHLLVSMWMNSGNVFGKMNLFTLVARRPHDRIILRPINI